MLCLSFYTLTCRECTSKKYFLVSWADFDHKIDLILVFWVLKITEKVSFSITSEASYVYILSGQKLIKNAKIVHLGVFWKLEACGGQTVLPDRSV